MSFRMPAFAVIEDHGIRLLASETLGDALREAQGRRLTIVPLGTDGRRIRAKTKTYRKELAREGRRKR